MKKALSSWCLLLLLLSPVAFAKSEKFKPHLGGAKRNQYLVKLAPGIPSDTVASLAQSLSATHKVRLLVVWENIPGFLVEGKLNTVLGLADESQVDFVEEDHFIYRGTSVATSVDVSWDGIPEDLWYLDRLDQPLPSPRDDTYNMVQDAANLTAYILDYAVWKNHHAFATRSATITAVNCAKEDANGRLLPCAIEDAALACKANVQHQEVVFVEQSHGTAVASLLSGNVTGAARPKITSVNIYPCRPGHAMFPDPPPGQNLTSTSYTLASTVTNGLNWIKTDVVARNNGGRAVVNHSGFLYPWDSQTSMVMEAVRSVVHANIPYFTSADNFSGDSCAFTPNNYAYTRKNKHWTRLVFSVAGTTLNSGLENNRMTGTVDVPWLRPRTGPDGWDPPNAVAARRVQDSGTNLGACVSAFAPAAHIYAAAHGVLNGTTSNANQYRLWADGTSWSSPLAAALALRWMATQTTPPSYTQVYNALLDKTTTVAAATTQAYTICYKAETPDNPNTPENEYDPGNPNDWIYFTDPNAECPNTYNAFRMPAVKNDPESPLDPVSADARMLYW